MRVISWWDLKNESVQLTANGPVFNQHVTVRLRTICLLATHNMAALKGWNTLIFNINMVNSKNSKMWMNQNKNTKYTSLISWIKWLHSNKEFCFTVNYRARTWRIINWPVDNVTFALQTKLLQYLPIGKMNTLWRGLSWGNLFDRTLAQLKMTGQLIMTNLHCKRVCYSNNSLSCQYQI